MRQIVILLALMASLSAGNIEDFASKMGYESSYEKAMAKAKREKKMVMLVMVTHYCPWCRKYERDTLSKKDIALLVAQKYVPLILNREKQEFPARFDTPRIPTTFFIDAQTQQAVYEEMGYKTKAEFLEMEAKVSP